ncbi:MAG: hypothetical protein IJ736_10165, partial [Firmicutes bacterium]|nr:hypothetical protein [Bacillota bacterium]
SGMFALWDHETYKHIDDYDKWEPLFVEDEDIEKQIKNNAFVPAYFHQDGCFGFELKIDEDLSDRERKYIIVQSEEYLFRSSGKAVLSGIDYIDSNVSPDEAIIIDIPEGFYSVKVYLIAWDDEPGAYLENGDVSPDALPDCIVVVKSDADRGKVYRTKVNTFSEDDQ